MKTTLALLTSIACVSPLVAGTPIESKAYKGPIEPTPCFADQEWQVDLFGQYSVGEGPLHGGIFRDHGWGGGIGINYFFTRNFGIGVDASWLYAKEADFTPNRRGDFNRDDFDGDALDGLDLDGDDFDRDAFDRDESNSGHTTLHNFSGSLIFRVPMDDLCLAPYVYVGGGATVDGEQWASAHAGVGVEYRFTPGKGVFLDGRWTYLGDRFGHDDLNYVSTRLGFRFVF